MGKAIIINDVNFASANLGRVTLVEEWVPLESLSITPVTGVIVNSHQMVVVYNPVNTTEVGVIWRITAGQQYASIDANTGLLTVNEGVTEEDVTVEVESTVDSSIKATLDIVVSNHSVLTWYVDNTAYATQVNGYDSKFFPLMVKQVSALDNKVVNRVKFYATPSGTTSVKLAKYSFNNINAPVLVSEIGVYPIVDGENIISFPDTELSQGQIIGVKEYNGTTDRLIGIRYSTEAFGTPIDGGWAQQKFNGTIFFAIGYYG